MGLFLEIQCLRLVHVQRCPPDIAPKTVQTDTLGHVLPRHEGPGFKPTQAQENPTVVWPPAALP